ncbi:MAG: deoxyguanosinetriphosphate triphosphohydrolase [Candidatus Omnitrophica bacterium]|nr:deoxyguanosinetriphosphate triphosphohydrolase [Candidatus Omnitrophota bacterium]
MLDHKQIREYEDSFLAPYATKSYKTKGRSYEEKEHPYRSAYQRDRDRVIHSAAFRRLEYKTQVFVNHEGDYYRTRLTHTLEVAQIARTIAASLKLNVDLTEAIALAHDLGHTPFGHSGEEALNELMIKQGGFNHNLQGLRVVDYLEARYPDFPGLNLSWEVREGIARHSSVFDKAPKIKEFLRDKSASLETQIVDIADEIAYDNHDLDDGLTSGLLKVSDLKNMPLWNQINSGIAKIYSGINTDIRKHMSIRSLINMQVTDLIRQTEKNIIRWSIKDYADVKKLDKKLVSFSPDMLKLRKPLRACLLDKLYRNYRVIRMSSKAKRFIKELFTVYIDNPRQLPDQTRDRIPVDGTKRAVCDYIAGMTDRCALDEYKKLFDPYEKV